MAPDEFKNLGFQDEDEGKREAPKLSRLEELKRENEELKRKHAVEKK
jgi:hypothetical protein